VSAGAFGGNIGVETNRCLFLFRTVDKNPPELPLQPLNQEGEDEFGSFTEETGMNIIDSTAQFEAWLASQIPLVQSDLDKKHADMASDPFVFLRATLYDWVLQFQKLARDKDFDDDFGHPLGDAPEVLSLVDFHIENVGTWRDAEGRLILGANDFDEAAPLWYTNDLVRLATSARIAIASARLSISVEDACAAILRGYVRCLKAGGKPQVLEEDNADLRAMAVERLKEPAQFWRKFDAGIKINAKVPKDVVDVLVAALPNKDLPYKLMRRTAGEGSLGRQRFVALSDWHGGRIAREAKSLVPSAVYWATGKKAKLHYDELIKCAVRCPDPYLHVNGDWIVRRLSPSCSRIDLASLPKQRHEAILLEAYGWEAGNIHMGTPDQVKAILKDLSRRPDLWLANASKEMERRTRKRFRKWRDHYQQQGKNR
jgi:hypothetical protein